jgi:hypothetical protein
VAILEEKIMDKYVCGIVMDWQMDKFLLVEEKKWQGLGGRIKDFTQHHEGFNFNPESPHEAMVRAFKTETDHEIKTNRWKCFFIKEYQNTCKIYFFVAFASFDEMIKIVQSRKQPQLKASVIAHTLVDVYWDPQQYTFDLPYIIPMIIREMKAGMFTKLDPEGVNSSAPKNK